MNCPHCGRPLFFGVVGRRAGQPDQWVSDWYATTLRRAQQEANERNEFAARGVPKFVGRVWSAEPLGKPVENAVKAGANLATPVELAAKGKEKT